MWGGEPPPTFRRPQMKRFFALFALLFALSVAASASTVTVLIPTFANYGQGAVCVVDAEYNSQFEQVFRAGDFATDHNDRNSALKLLAFFKDVDTTACYVPK